MTDPIKPSADSEPAAATAGTDVVLAPADDPERDQDTAEVAEAETAQEQDVAAKTKRRSVPIFLWLILAVMVLLAAAMALAGYKGWAWYKNVDAQYAELKAQSQANAGGLKSIESEVLEFGQSVTQVSTTVRETLSKADQQTTAKLQQQNNILKQQNSTLQRMGTRLDGQQTRINTLSTTSREDWLLAEAEYLLRLANQRVLLENNARNAIALLEAADEIVKQVAAGLGDPELFAIRKTLGRELTQLRLIDHVDKEGLYIQLGSLADEVESLPRVRQTSLAAAKPGQLIELEGAPAATWSSNLWASIKESAGALSQYVKISDAESPAVPLMSDESALVVGMNVRLLMQQAQLAILKEEPVIYQHSLEKALLLIQTYYIDSAAVSEYKSRIQQHLAVKVAPEMPDISSSLKLLNGFIKKLHKIKG